MPGALNGGFIYVEFTILSGVRAFVSIKRSIDDKDVMCAVQTGDVLLLRHPYKMYLSFQAK